MTVDVNISGAAHDLAIILGQILAGDIYSKRDGLRILSFPFNKLKQKTRKWFCYALKLFVTLKGRGQNMEKINTYAESTTIAVNGFM